jgi:hypothetical protein
VFIRIDVFTRLFFFTEDFDEQIKAAPSTQISIISNVSSDFDAEFITIDKNDFYPDAVSSFFSLLVDCFS